MKPKRFTRIFCEGEVTEPNYFRGLIKANRIQGVQIPKVKDNSPMGIVKAGKAEYKKAKRARIPIKEISIWAVFDKDDHANISNAIQMAKDNNINIAFSNICFEYWILLHFEKGTKPFTNCDEIIKYIRNNYDNNYLKKNDHYERLKDKIEVAVKNNTWLLKKHWEFELKDGTSILKLNPYTDVGSLVTFLLSLKS